MDVLRAYTIGKLMMYSLPKCKRIYEIRCSVV